jgi:hypothetical protein
MLCSTFVDINETQPSESWSVTGALKIDYFLTCIEQAQSEPQQAVYAYQGWKAAGLHMTPRGKNLTNSFFKLLLSFRKR